MDETNCPDCAEPVSADDGYCENCGADLSRRRGGTADALDASGSPCRGCGDPAPADPGEEFCPGCGLRRRDGTDRVETDLGALAGVSDRGLAHAKNEDAMALGRRRGRAGGPGAGLAAVVCDGVSTVRTPELASRLAAETALGVLLADAHSPATPAPDASGEAGPEPDTWDAVTADGADPGDGAAGPGEPVGPADGAAVPAEPVGPADAGQAERLEEIEDRVRAAVAAAADAVATLGEPDQRDAPSCTLVCAWVAPDPAGATVTVAWVGDSRAYWLSEQPDVEPSTRRTTDHSWAYALVEAGALDESAAMAHPRAHAITRWLGAGGDPDPDVVSWRPAGPGVLLLCSDGLWNYLPDADELAAAARVGDSSPDAGGTLDMTRRLTGLALDAGGRDNITVVAVPVPGPGRIAATPAGADATAGPEDSSGPRE